MDCCSLFYVAADAVVYETAFQCFFWSFSFGISALATTALHLSVGEQDGLFAALAVPMFVFTNVVIALLMVKTMILLMQKG